MTIRHISREDYKGMLDKGLVFRNWSLYEPDQTPNRDYLIVNLGNGLTANKVLTSQIATPS